jgi:Patatin-like phospholipase
MGWHRTNSVIKVLLLINRNALFLVPLVGGTFLLMAGKIGTSYGTQYLFRDNQLGFDSGWLLLAQSTRVFSALYATALMGLTWTLFVLIEERDEDPSSLHPITDVRSILFPPVLVLSLPMIAAALVNLGENDAYWVVVLLSLLGLGGGLLVVAGVTGLGLMISRHLRIHQLWTFIVLSAVIVGGVSWLPVITPSKAIFLTLAACVLIYCLFDCVPVQFRTPAVVLVLSVLLVGSFVPSFKYKFPDLEPYYANWSQTQPRRSREPGTAPLLDPRATLEAWLVQQSRVSSEPPKLVIVATSGGAYRATFWTAVVLDKLTSDSRLPGFERSIRLMTGASGGMVGAAYFAVPRPSGASQNLKDWLLRELHERGKKTTLLTNSKVDSLTPVVQTMIGWDLFNAFLPYTTAWDRGQVLQDQWPSLQVEFARLQEDEQNGSRPSLIISPYLVDSGKPLFISNLNLGEMIADLKTRPTKDEGKATAAISDETPDFAVEFFKEFPQAVKTLKVATAVRMSATFPFISPAVRLPLQNRSRVVDAGYFDNFGITAAAAFLRHHAVQEFVEKKTSGVVLIRILAFPDMTKKDEIQNAVERNTWSGLQQGIEQISSPLEGALAARETRGQFANQLLLQQLRATYGAKFDDFVFADTRPGSFSWHLQDHEIQAIADCGFTVDKKCDDPVNANDPGNANDKELQRLAAVWARRGPNERK